LTTEQRENIMGITAAGGRFREVDMMMFMREVASAGALLSFMAMLAVWVDVILHAG
jgi:hypothetical protein